MVLGNAIKNTHEHAENQKNYVERKSIPIHVHRVSDAGIATAAGEEWS